MDGKEEEGGGEEEERKRSRSRERKGYRIKKIRGGTGREEDFKRAKVILKAIRCQGQRQRTASTTRSIFSLI